MNVINQLRILVSSSPSENPSATSGTTSTNQQLVPTS